MEFIRIKYGSENPNALISGSLAGLAGNTMIFALPGSVRAVEEYFTEIARCLKHLVYMRMGLDIH
jgi:molybdopterin biosynthesis enzyme MoaB